MRRAAAGAGDGVPGIRDSFAGRAGAWVDEGEGEAGEGGEVDASGGVGAGWEGDAGELQVLQVFAGAVVGGFGDVGGECCVWMWCE